MSEGYLSGLKKLRRWENHFTVEELVYKTYLLTGITKYFNNVDYLAKG